MSGQIEAGEDVIRRAWQRKERGEQKLSDTKPSQGSPYAYESSNANSKAYEDYMGTLKQGENEPDNIDQAILDIKQIIEKCEKNLQQDG